MATLDAVSVHTYEVPDRNIIVVGAKCFCYNEKPVESPYESDANIRENRYANVVLSGRTTMFQWIFVHMERNRRRWLHPQ